MHIQKVVIRLLQDENGQVDKKDTSHNNMYKVKTANSEFWTSDLKVAKKQIKKANTDVNQKANTDVNQKARLKK